jgi:hypothetical protein
MLTGQGQNVSSSTGATIWEPDEPVLWLGGCVHDHPASLQALCLPCHPCFPYHYM